ncbi:MAG: serine/threonine-protein kinase [Polyangiales bacterium]
MPGEPARPPANPAEIQKLGRYILRYRIAQGGMASVYLARLQSQAGFEKWVAVKTIHPHIATSPKFVSMFMDEARLAARLDHPNLCTVFDFGEQSGTYFIAMEYLHGESLGVVARRSWGMGLAMPLEYAARVLADAARGLHAAHELRMDSGMAAGVVHRDVSPENIFVTYAGISKIVDFGVARSEVQNADRTATGELKGKVAYMSPEQIREARVDRRTDIWAAGVVLWEVTVGRRLFRRHSDAATVLAVLRDTIPLPSRVREDYPELLEAIVMRALERDPARRFQTTLEFARALESFLSASGLPAGAGDVGEFMQTLFADQIAMRDEVLRQGARAAPLEELVAAWQGAAPTPPPPAPLEAEYEPADDAPPSEAITAPRRDFDPGYQDQSEVVIPLTREVEERPRTVYVGSNYSRGAAGGSLGALFGAAIAVVIGALLYVVLRPHPRATRRPGPPATSAPVAAPAAAPVVAPAPAVSPTPDAAPAPVAQPPPAPAPAPVRVAAPVRAPTPEPRRPRPVAVVSAATSPPEAPAPTRPGYLSFVSTPPADVYEGDRLLGATPLLDRTMSPGPHSFRFVLRDGSAARTVQVDVQSGATSVVNVNWPSP